MALLLILLFPAILIFLLYYELIWKRFESKKGKSLVGITSDFIFSDDKSGEEPEKHVAVASSPWSDWKYRLMVELHRKNQLKPEEAARAVGVSLAKAEAYLDKLESEGKVQQIGDSERGIFYKVLTD
jgi:hypothetical protein